MCSASFYHQKYQLFSIVSSYDGRYLRVQRSSFSILLSYVTMPYVGMALKKNGGHIDKIQRKTKQSLMSQVPSS